ncbi:hypothetical protein JCM8547_000570 [Rhodosporidiobolus lusitaniae]
MSTRTGICCVCGVPASTRCPTCGGAGLDLFFCSTEHQKLVWKSHKRVCGHPSFPHPLLTEEESQLALSARNDKVATPMSAATELSLSNVVRDIIPMPDEQVPILIQTVTAGITAPPPPLPLRNLALASIRSLLPRLRLAHLPSPLAASQNRPFDSLAHVMLRRSIQRAGPPVLVEPEWLGEFQHLLLIALVLFEKLHAGEGGTICLPPSCVVQLHPPKPFAGDISGAARGLLCLLLAEQQSLPRPHDQRCAPPNPFFQIGALLTPLSWLTPHLLEGGPEYRFPTSAAHRALVLFDLVQRSRSASPPSIFDKSILEYAFQRFVEELTKGKPFANGEQAAFFFFVLDTAFAEVGYTAKRCAYNHGTKQLDYTGLSA